MGNLGIGELAIIALIAVVLFGANRFADIGKGLGQGIKNFKQGLKEAEDLDTKKPTATTNDKDATKPS